MVGHQREAVEDAEDAVVVEEEEAEEAEVDGT